MEKIMEWLKVLGPVGPWVLAIVILIAGYFVARIIRKCVEVALNKTALDEKLAKALGNEPGGVGKGVGMFVFYLVLLFVVIFALGVVGQDTAIEPLKDLLDKFLGFIPKLVACGVILFVAWLLAKIVRELLTGLLSGVKLDERIGTGAGDDKPVTKAIAITASFAIVLIMLPQALATLEMKSVSEPIQKLIDQIFAYIPKLFAGIVILAIGFLIAWIVQRVLENVLAAIGTDKVPGFLGYKNEIKIGGQSLSGILSYVAMATILVMTVSQAVLAMDLKLISELADGFVDGYLRILGAVIIIAVALFLANLVGGWIQPKSATWAKVARIAILVFLGAAALQRAGISDLTNGIPELAMRYAIYALALALGVGGAIAFGLGGREQAGKWLSKKLDK